MNSKPLALIAGLTRDSAKYLRQHVTELDEILAQYFKTSWFVVESDSTDATHNELRLLSKSMADFKYTCLGNLEPTLPRRVDRLAYCRNKYLEKIRNDTINFEYLVVIDLDRVITDADLSELGSILSNSEWSGIFANIDGPYYDLYALRHSLWNPNNPFLLKERLLEIGLSERAASRAAVTSRMIKIPKTAKWISVKSAFGGFGIYRTRWLLGAEYAGVDASGELCSEHVALNEMIWQSGGKLFVIPSLTIARKTEHTKNLTPFREAIRSYLISKRN